MKYFKVEAKCGHVGRHNYIKKPFYLKAIDGKEAASRVRKFPRVKHHQKYAICNVCPITYEEYVRGVEYMKKDPYFLCKTIQDQKMFVDDEFYKEIIREPEIKKKKKHSSVRRHKIYDVFNREWLRGELVYEY